MDVDIDPSVLLPLPDSGLFRVNGVRDVISATKQPPTSCCFNFQLVRLKY